MMDHRRAVQKAQHTRVQTNMLDDTEIKLADDDGAQKRLLSRTVHFLSVASTRVKI